jgi:pyruvate formate lyase activating enzyme
MPVRVLDFLIPFPSPLYSIILLIHNFLVMEGIIFDIKHYALHDGPGVRQTVFLKGCPLSCWWCHNPESQSREILTFRKEEKIDGHVVSDQETLGWKTSVPELMKEIERDSLLYEESDGGVTFSGGEPLLQFDFLLALLKACKDNDIHTCVDTTAFVSSEKLKQAAPFTDLFMVDLKQMDAALHKKYTGVSNTLILDNIRLLDAEGKKMWIRYPMIPGMNDQEENLLKMLAFLQKLQHKPMISILPYHKIGSHKYKRFELEYKMGNTPEPDSKQIEKVKGLFEKAGFETQIGG